MDTSGTTERELAQSNGQILGSRTEEVWRVIPSIPTHEVSTHGRVRRIEAARNWAAGKMLSVCPDRKGYLRVYINGKGRPVHAMICEAFNGPGKAGQLCRHLNDHKDDIRPENLAWGSALENSADARRNGKLRRHVLRFDRLEARHLRAGGLSYDAIGRRFGVTGKAVRVAITPV